MLDSLYIHDKKYEIMILKPTSFIVLTSTIERNYGYILFTMRKGSILLFLWCDTSIVSVCTVVHIPVYLKAVLIISFHVSRNLKFFENVSATVTRFELNFIHSKSDTVSLICITVYHGVTRIVSSDRPATNI